MNNKEKIINDFSILYCGSSVIHGGGTRWLGVPTVKIPFDLWVYQEIIFSLKPDIIVECGTAWGGSALFLACICEVMNHGKVITIDVAALQYSGHDRPEHERIEYLIGPSTSQGIVDKIKSEIGADDKVMVILDSDHHKAHVLKEMKIYSELVSVGSYLIVEDTNINGHPVLPSFGPGPMEAVEEFLESNGNFIIDKSREKFLFTLNPKGYLKKIR